MWQTTVVFFDVEPHQFLDGLYRVERVEEEPLVLQDSSPRFDRWVGKRDLRSREHSIEQSRFDEFIDRTIEVLNSTVSQYHWFAIGHSFRRSE